MMNNKLFTFFCLIFSAVLAAEFCYAQNQVSQQTQQALQSLPGFDRTLEKYDTTAIVQIPDMSPSEDKSAGNFTSITSGAQGTSGGQQSTTTLAPVQNPQTAALDTPVKNALSEPIAQEELQQANQQAAKENKKAAKKKKEGFGLKLDGQAKDEDDGFEIPAGTLAVYIDIEEAFNNNPWTIKARKNIKVDLEATQIEYAKMQSQLQELKKKLVYLGDELTYYSPYYTGEQYVSAMGDKQYPVLQIDQAEKLSKDFLFAPSAAQTDSPINIPLKIEQLKSAIRDTKKDIIQKEAFLVDYRELSKEEILSRQDYIVQQILKQIYSGIKEFASVRNIGLVVDKKDLIFGKPLNVTPEFVKWMKSYNKKYIKENGDLL